LDFPVFPRFAFISGRFALIFQKVCGFTSFFRNFAVKNGELFRFAQGNFSVSAKKETSFFVLLSTFRNFAAK